jgi:hypothetical protein
MVSKPKRPNTKAFWVFAITVLWQARDLPAIELKLISPSDYQVVQRSTRDRGTLRIVGQLTQNAMEGSFVEARLLTGADAVWQRLDAIISERVISASMDVTAGGWNRLEVRISNNQVEYARDSVEHVGIGEVFVIAGQSNSANHGEQKQTPNSGRVASLNDTTWQIANDPQPGASGTSGSFMPSFGDALVEKLNVPVGLVACGIGATSVREWLPRGSSFPNPPTLVGRVEQSPSGEWTSKGDAFNVLVAKMKVLGPHGYRAVLWHQGESDANQKDPTRTLPGNLYRQYLEKIILESRHAVGWEMPWFVAQATYHIPGDEEWPDIREAQASLWKDNIALQGPDTDALKGELRERNGRGVHFSETGLRVHGKKWADKVLPWIIEQNALKTRF